MTEAMVKQILQKSISTIKKALAVAPDQGDSSLLTYLPAPLANEVIGYIRDICQMRKLIPSFNQPQRNWKKPKKSTAMAAYYVPDGVRATETGYTTGSVTWSAKKLMTNTHVDEETIEDSQPDVVSEILKDFAESFAEAEDYAIIQGDTAHLATAPDPTSATTSNWYNKDPRLMFDGIFTVAGGVDAATSVDGNGLAFDVDMVNRAIYNLGKYGRNKAMLQGLVPSEQAANIRGNAELKQYQLTGLVAAQFNPSLTGSAGEGNGKIVNIYGVDFFEAPFAPAGQIAMYHKMSPMIGDRRRIKLENDKNIEADQRRYVGSERISFNFNYRDALVLIENLSQTIVS